MRAGIGGSLKSDLRARLVVVHSAPAADATGYARQRRTGQGEDIGVELRRVHDVDVEGAAPAREGAHMPHRVRAPEALDRKRRHRPHRAGDTVEPRTSGFKTCEVDCPAIGIETSNELDHLAFGSTGFEPGHDQSYGSGARHAAI